MANLRYSELRYFGDVVSLAGACIKVHYPVAPYRFTFPAMSHQLPVCSRYLRDAEAGRQSAVQKIRAPVLQHQVLLLVAPPLLERDRRLTTSRSRFTHLG